MKLAIRLGLVLALGTVATAAAQSEATNSTTTPPLGAVSAKAAPDLAQLKYLLGEWSVQNFARNDAGEFEESPVRSIFRARYLRDGLSLMAEYFEARTDGFYGFHIVTHDPERGLVHRYFDALRNQRIEFLGDFHDGGYDITRRGGYNGQGDFLYRETDSEITPGSFVKRIYRSPDEGKTWQEGDYYFRFTRVQSASTSGVQGQGAHRAVDGPDPRGATIR
ncbi:MAG: hypothetical protein AAF657_14385 [Acidobacteriota bacterium]